MAEEAPPILLSSLPTSRAQRGAALIFAAFLFVIFVAAELHGDSRWPAAPGFAALSAGIESFAYLLTAALLFASFSVQRSRGLLFLAAGYAFTGLILVSWALSFPGTFALHGLFGGAQSTFYIAVLQSVSPGLAALAYVAAAGSLISSRFPDRTILVAVALVFVLAVGLTWAIVAEGDNLPQMMLDPVHVSPLWRQVAPLLVVLYVLAAGAVALRSVSVLDTWLTVSLWSSLLKSVLLLKIEARFNFGWYVSVFFPIFSASAVLVALLSQVTTLYTRLAISTLTQRRERENRLLAVDAALASVAHQTYQPISAIMTNANVARRALAGSNPDLAEVGAMLNDIEADGRRAADAIGAIRAIFRADGSAKTTLDVSELLGSVLLLAKSDLQARHIVVDVAVDESLPQVSGNKPQLQQVLLNLIANAAEAMDHVAVRARRLRVGAVREGNRVLVTLQDSGLGIDPKLGESVFDPFVTTKSKGTGLGLAICRSIIDAHGGRLRLIEGLPGGAIAQFTLPVADA